MFVYARYSLADFERVKALCRENLSDRTIARSTGFPLSTVTNWRRRTDPPRSPRPLPTEFVPTSEAAYSYLLGEFLGDGHLWSTGPTSWRLGFSCDSKYPGIINEIDEAITACDPETNVCRNTVKGVNIIVVLASSPLWPLAFPQHGPGRKHLRPIVLEDWQAELCRREPEALLRGLIHSDGCRCENRFKTKLPSGRVAEYAYPRYFFTNLSADIRGIFCRHCELLGIRWTQSNARNISVAHRRSVAILDGFVGPKE